MGENFKVGLKTEDRIIKFIAVISANSYLQFFIMAGPGIISLGPVSFC